MINSTFAATIEISANPEDTPEIKNTNLFSGFILTLSRCTYTPFVSKNSR